MDNVKKKLQELKTRKQDLLDEINKKKESAQKILNEANALELEFVRLDGGVRILNEMLEGEKQKEDKK